MTYNHLLVVDRRITVLELKKIIAKKFDFSIYELVFKRGGSHGVELIEE